MADKTAISPLLDQMTVGALLGSHGGISCYALQHTATGQKFALKCVSIPASEEKVQALILSGAYADETAANDYFRHVADDVTAELDAAKTFGDCPNLLRPLDYQVVAKESGVGFDVYIVYPWQTSLKEYVRDNAMTHLRAVNLGIDLCSALCALHSGGYVFENLKPENVFLSETGAFLLGDLGLAPMLDMHFASLPEQYLGSYSAPELSNIMSGLNATIDIYSLGILLYRIYNGNHAPFEDEKTSAKAADGKRLDGEALPAPLFADYELAEIILKACAYLPEDRYQTPEEMKQALEQYMQRNVISDNLIVPPLVSTPEPELTVEEAMEEAEPVRFASEDKIDDAFRQHFSPDTASLDAIIAAVRADEAKEAAARRSKAQAEPQKPPQPAPAAPEEAPASPEESTVLPEAEPVQEVSAPLEQPETEAVPASDTQPDAAVRRAFETPCAIVIDDDGQLLPPQPEVEAPEAEEPAAEDTTLALAEEDIASPAPEPLPQEDSVQEAPGQEKEDPNPPLPKKKKSKAGWIVLAAIVAVLAAAVAVYQFTDFGKSLYHYFIHIDSLTVTDVGTDTLSVSVQSDAYSLPVKLTCSDVYGNAFTAELDNGSAVFTGLTPGTQYTVNIVAEGLHRITGATTCSVGTKSATEVLTFSASSGNQEGAVLLTLVLKDDNTAPSEWTVSYVCDGAEAKMQSFSGDSTQISGLEVGKEYTFTLVSSGVSNIVGVTTATFTPVKAVTAEGLSIVSFIDGKLTVGWTCTSEAPELWTVTCCDDNGKELTAETAEPQASFEGLSLGSVYYVEVSAPGLFQNLSLTVPGDMIYLDALSTQMADDGLHVWWESGETPADGWLVVASLGSEDYLTTATTAAENGCVLTKLIPGVTYTITVESADERKVVGHCTTQYTTEAAPALNLLGLESGDLSVAVYLTPEGDSPSYDDLGKAASDFSSTDSICFGLVTEVAPEKSPYEVTVLYLLRDENGTPVDYYSGSVVWDDLWAGGHYLGVLQRTPAATGDYTLEIYISYQLAAAAKLHITAVEPPADGE
ncbi:MAG: protein kinase [Candidatus Faecousia sp.]|nr:protein kinase [Candidatus Faecousia sp.]